MGINDNFFEMGGHSLKAMQIIGRITNCPLELMAFFRYPTIAELSNYIQTVCNKEEPVIVNENKA